MLKAKRVALRHMIEADLPYILAHQGTAAGEDPYTGTLMTSPSEIKRRFAETGYSTPESEKLMVLDENERVIGTVMHFKGRPYSNSREIGWVIYDQKDRRKGYASEAVRLLVDYLFQNFQINRLECATSSGNVPSLALARSVGFQHEGVLRDFVFVRGVYEDSTLLSMLREDWQRLTLAS